MIDALLEKVQNKWISKVNYLIAEERQLYITACSYEPIGHQGQPGGQNRIPLGNLPANNYGHGYQQFLNMLIFDKAIE